MFKPGMKVRHKTDTFPYREATLISPDQTRISKRKGWKISIFGYSTGFWFLENIVPIVPTNEEAVVLLNKTDTF